MSYNTFKQCERKSCLYHPPDCESNGCDYCYLTGQPRECPAGTTCDKYKRASHKAKLAFRKALLNNGGITIDSKRVSKTG